MQQKYWLTLLLLLLVPGVMFAQSGKIRGTVVDSKTKEPLVGANVVLEVRATEVQLIFKVSILF